MQKQDISFIVLAKKQIKYEASEIFLNEQVDFF